ncbi:MAG: hypothetical protein JST19_04170 [Bacteroidetes bacterium]|nr:hypothetical protein [Bacteroidota bacterium]
MRLIASILIMYFGALMAQPFVNMGFTVETQSDSCHAGMCCKEKRQHNAQKPAREQSDTCNRDFCNPFVPCGVSLICRVPAHSFTNLAFEVPKQLKPAINDHITSSYLSDCWRPPELLS